MAIPPYARRVQRNRQVMRQMARDHSNIIYRYESARGNAEYAVQRLRRQLRTTNQLVTRIAAANDSWLELAAEISELQQLESDGETGQFRTARDLQRAIQQKHRDAERVKSDQQRLLDELNRVVDGDRALMTALIDHAR